MSRRAISVFLALCAAGGQAADQPFAALNLEAHGFASFGYLRSWGNDWLGPTRGGTTEFWESAVNTIARPTDRLRLGAQLFVRDLGNHDNGRMQLDWAYADWRWHDALGLQVGRVKLPLGLFNETLDVDAARTAIFLPPCVYVLRSRDLYVSTDGGKLYGMTHLGDAGRLEYALFGGAKRIDPKAGFATFMSEQGLGDSIDSIGSRWLAGGMIHWATPVQGLGFRLSGLDLHKFAICGSSATRMSTTTEVENYYIGFASVIYETSAITWAAEYSRLRGRGDTRIDPMGIVRPLIDNADGAYVNATWHCQPWLEFYAAGEGAWSDAVDRNAPRSYTAVLAVNLNPLRNWSLKAEFRDVHGNKSAVNYERRGDLEGHWQVFALKTTVDF